MARLALQGNAYACRMLVKRSHLKISGYKKATSKVAGQREIAQAGIG